MGKKITCPVKNSVQVYARFTHIHDALPMPFVAHS